MKFVVRNIYYVFLFLIKALYKIGLNRLHENCHRQSLNVSIGTFWHFTIYHIIQYIIYTYTHGFIFSDRITSTFLYHKFYILYIETSISSRSTLFSYKYLYQIRKICLYGLELEFDPI